MRNDELSLSELYRLLRNPPAWRTWIRFFSNIEIDLDSPLKCWIWKGARTEKNYGQFCWRKTMQVHRLMAIWLYGDLPKSLHVDHVVCSNPPCVNPLHLIPHSQIFNLTRPGSKSMARVNKMRTHCAKGHELSGYNLAVTLRSDGSFRQRKCRTCWYDSGHGGRKKTRHVSIGPFVFNNWKSPNNKAPISLVAMSR